jgi:AAA domain, putative AbiEii toxin, Type IV TA system/AAA domain
MPAPVPAPIPIGIRKISVEDFRGIRSLDLNFLDAGENASDIVVFAGPNGGGKTSILEACLLALGHPELIRSPSSSPVVHTGRPFFRISAQLHVGGENSEVSFGSVETPERSPRHLRPSRELPCLYFSSWRAPKLVGPLSVTAGRRGKRPSDTEENRLWLVKQFLVNAKAHAFMGGPAQLEGMSLFETSLQRLNEMWSLFHPGHEQSFSIEPVGQDPDAGFDVLLIGPDGARIPLDCLSSGQLELFTFFGAFLHAKFQEGVVIIDEPELHLDPQWHTLMLQAIRRFLPRVQILVATHSPAVFDSVYSFQRHLLLPTNDPRNVSWMARPSGVA